MDDEQLTTLGISGITDARCTADDNLPIPVAADNDVSNSNQLLISMFDSLTYT
jgi:hypothetical protein